MENHNLLSVFSFKGHRIRYTKNNSEYWWVAKDIQKLFAIPQTSESLEIINQDEFSATYTSFDLLAIAVEKGDRGCIKDAEAILIFVSALISNGYATPALERIYHACRIFQAYSQQKYEIGNSIKSSVVYLIGCKKNQAMKIGTSTNISKRIIGLQNSSPFSLEVLATVKGGQPLEQEFHKEFEQYRLSGEWFSWSEDILAKFKSVLIAQNLEEN